MLKLEYNGPPENVLIWDHNQEFVYDKIINGWALDEEIILPEQYDQTR